MAKRKDVTHWCCNCAKIQRMVKPSDGAKLDNGVYHCAICNHLVDVNDPRDCRKLAILTPEEARMWETLFEYEKGQGKSDAAADRRVWGAMIAIFPRLAMFNGCLPEHEVTAETPLGDRMGFCGYCGDALKIITIGSGRHAETLLRCDAGRVVFKQTTLGTLELQWSEGGEMLGRVHNYID